jgi:predicted TIM-barrel fold metal-dependent hydrolase
VNTTKPLDAIVRTAACLLFLTFTVTACHKQPDPKSVRKIDVHTHLSLGGMPQLLPMLDEWGIDTVIDLSGGPPGQGLEQHLALAKQAPGRIVVFCTPDFREVLGGDGYGERMAQQLEHAHALGAKGMKIFKSLGLHIPGPDGKPLPVDDPGLDALFDKAGELGMPVAIHTGDPKTFWLPVDANNERLAELSAHPRWSYFRKPVPSWDALFAQFEHLVAKHPKTIFIGVHFGNDPEDPKRVGELLDKYPNLYVDTAARVPEIGRGDVEPVRDLFLRHSDRILFGTDVAVGDSPDQLWLGSRGNEVPGPADVKRFYSSTFRFFETRDRGFESPTPIQGSWTVSGIGLPPEILAKIYSGNAKRLLGL